MDQRSKAQDVIRCDLCKKSIAEMHCDTCLVNMCKPCVGEHMSDESKDHKVVKFQSRKSTPVYPYCSVHPKERCEMHCQPCQNPICSACVASEEHKCHKITQILQIWESKKQEIQRDNSELQSTITPLYQKMLDRVLERTREIEENAEETDKSITRHGEKWHEEVNKIVEVLKAQNDQNKKINRNNLKTCALEMTEAMSKITKIVEFNEDLFYSFDLGKGFNYACQKAAFRKGPNGVYAPVPTFHALQIQQEKLIELFGSLSTVSPQDLRFPSSYIYPETGQLLMKEPQLVTIFNSRNLFPTNVFDIVLFDKHIVLILENEIEVISIENSVRIPVHVIPIIIHPFKWFNDREKRCYSSASKRGDLLIYCDPQSNSVNIEKNHNGLREELIRLQTWSPRGVCFTSSGDMLVTMILPCGTHTCSEIQGENPPKVVRYTGTLEKQTIQFDDNGKAIFSSTGTLYITENKNKDICVSCKEEVVVVSGTGERRFQYTPKEPLPFCPIGLATDSYCHILIADNNNGRVHVIDQTGKFLRYIDLEIRKPWGLCIDTENFLFVADLHGRKIVEIRYLQ